MARPKTKPLMQILKIAVLAAFFFAVAAAFQHAYNASLVPASADPATNRPRLAKLDYWEAVLLLAAVPLFFLGGSAFLSAAVAGVRIIPYNRALAS